MQFNKYREREREREREIYIGHEALRQAHLPIREGRIRINNSKAIKRAAYIGRHALVLGHVVAAFAQGNLPSFLERPPERPMVPALLDKLKTVATEVKKTK